MKYILLLTSLSTMAHAVIISESVVRAPDHIVPLSLLAKGYKLASLAKDKQTKTLAEIKNHKKTTVDQLYVIRAGDNLVRAAHGQTFYDPQLQKWVKSEDITTANHLLDEKGKRVSVNSIIHRVGQFPAVEVEVDGSHYLYADGVLTHNDGGIISGALVFVGLTAVRWVLGVVFGDGKKRMDAAYKNAIDWQESQRVRGAAEPPVITRQAPTGARGA